MVGVVVEVARLTTPRIDPIHLLHILILTLHLLHILLEGAVHPLQDSSMAFPHRRAERMDIMTDNHHLHLMGFTMVHLPQRVVIMGHRTHPLVDITMAHHKRRPIAMGITELRVLTATMDLNRVIVVGVTMGVVDSLLRICVS